MNPSKDTLVFECLLATNSSRRRREKGKRKRKLWCHDWFKRRNESSLVHFHSKLKFVLEEWHNYLDLDEQAYFKLLALVTPRIQKKDTIMRTAISPHERLTATLRYLATGRSLEDLKFTTTISPQSLGRIIPETCEAIYKVLHKEYLKFPQTEEEWKNIASEFEEKYNFPHCLGAMDVRHVSINPPYRTGSTFFNYKGGHSMALLAIVNAKHEFILCDFGTNGCISDKMVLKNTKFFKKLQEEKLNIPGSSKVEKSEHDLPFVFVVDNAFPLRKEMMKPFKQQELIPENRKVYNCHVSSAQTVIENVFATLNKRFRVLQTIINLKPHKIESVVMACCVLHNFLSRSNSSYCSQPDYFPQENIDAATTISGLDVSNSNILGLDENNPGNAVLSAKIVRERFVNYFVTEDQVPQKSNFI